MRTFDLNIFFAFLFCKVAESFKKDFIFSFYAIRDGLTSKIVRKRKVYCTLNLERMIIFAININCEIGA
jgi:hypothetical protein